MKFDLKAYLKKAQNFWNAQSKKKKITYGSIAGGALALVVLFVAIFAGSGSKVTLYENLAANEASRVVAKLRSAGIEASLDEGAVSVPKVKAAEAEMQLSLDGYARAPYSYDIFKEGNSLLSSDSEKKAYLLFQLQDKIESAIKTIEGIEDAMVTIALPETSSFVLEEDKEKPSAWVKLTIGGLVPQITGKQVSGIKTQVARSVPGLEVERVAVLDNRGNLLESDDEVAKSEKDNDFMKQKEKVDSSIRSKVLALLEPMFGKDNVKVEANSTLNYDGRKTRETFYSPVVGDNGIIEHREEISILQESGSQSNAESGLGLIEGNAEVSNYPEQEGQSENSSSSKRDVSEDFLVNKREEQTVKNTPTIETVSVAVTINKETMSEQQRSGIRRLVASAAGISEDRVELYNMEFTSITGLDSSMTVGEFFRTPLGIVVLTLSCIVILLALIVAISLLRSRKKAVEGQADLVAPQMSLEEFINSTPAPAQNLEAVESDEKATFDFGQDVPVDLAIETPESRPESREENQKEIGSDEEKIESQEEEMRPLDNVLKFVDESPEIAAQFVKHWLRSGDTIAND